MPTQTTAGEHLRDFADARRLLIREPLDYRSVCGVGQGFTSPSGPEMLIAMSAGALVRITFWRESGAAMPA
jgi:hypothetical protein